MNSKPKYLSLILAVVSIATMSTSQTAPVEDFGDLTASLFRGLGVYNEPSIHDSCSAEYGAFRLFEYSGGRPNYILRVEQGSNFVRAISNVHDYSNNFSSNTMTMRQISENQWKSVVSAFESSGFWDTETTEDVWIPEGPSWVVEGCMNSKYHFLELYPSIDFRMQNVADYLRSIFD